VFYDKIELGMHNKKLQAEPCVHDERAKLHCTTKSFYFSRGGTHCTPLLNKSAQRTYKPNLVFVNARHLEGVG